MIYTLQISVSSAIRKVIRTAGAEEMEPLVLTVDIGGLPQAWVELEEAITYHAKQMVAWSVGREVREFRGGWQKERRAFAHRDALDPRDQRQQRGRASTRAGPHQSDAVRA